MWLRHNLCHARDAQLFPFDQHDINMTFMLDGFENERSDQQHLFGCDFVTNKLRLRSSTLLPKDNSWFLKDIVNEQTASVCRMRITVKRNSIVFFIKNIIVLIIIVQGALLALRLNPLVPPLVGGRFAAQIFAMTLIANRTNVDLKPTLGNVTELLWLDW